MQTPSRNPSLEREIIGLEKQYWQAMQKQDLKTAIRLTDFPCIVASECGTRVVDEKKFTEMFEAHRGESIRSFEMSPMPEIRLLNSETAVIAYEVRAVVEKDGKEQAMNAVDTSTWIRRDGKWVCALHTEIQKTTH